MSLRTRLLLAFAAIVFIPIAVLALGLRQEMTRRLSDEYERRLDSVVEIIGEDLRIESDAIGDRLASLEQAILDDNPFRAALRQAEQAVGVAGVERGRDYLIDYAGTAQALTGLSMLQILDEDDRIVSSGHFRNEHGGRVPGLAGAMARVPGGVALVRARTPERDFLALARSERLDIGERRLTLIGGIAVDDALLGRLARDREIRVSLRHPHGVLASGASIAEDVPPAPVADASDALVSRAIAIPLIESDGGSPSRVVSAQLEIEQSRAPIEALLRSADVWFLGTAAATSLTAFLLAVWVSSRISRPLAALADKTAVLDLDRLDVDFDAGSGEVGRLSQLLGDLAARLRSSTARIREAERRATVGDLARQINHDIKNGLIPLRNVVRHLTQVGRDSPDELSRVFADRRQTIDSSIAYLETLASNYERLSPRADRRDCNLNALVAEVVQGAREHEHVDLQTRLQPGLPRVVGDPVAIRRILENLIANAIDSLESKPGQVTISTEMVRAEGQPSAIRLTVADTGCGMSTEEANRIFADFYTTKPGGTGLGLSIVRRLVMDLQGTLRVDSVVGKGTRMIIELPGHS